MRVLSLPSHPLPPYYLRIPLCWVIKPRVGVGRGGGLGGKHPYRRRGGGIGGLCTGNRNGYNI